MARARVFEVEEAIENVIPLFWEKGYDKTSLSDLTQAMGVTPPSFYYAFGNKEGLFRRVLQHYLDTRLSHAEAALQSESDVRQAVQLMLTRMADLYTDRSHPPGCLAVNLSFSGTDLSDQLRKEIRQLADARKKRLVGRLQQAVTEGQLPADADVRDLARFIMTVGWGMAHDARGGATKGDLLKTVAQAMRAWPD